MSIRIYTTLVLRQYLLIPAFSFSYSSLFYIFIKTSVGYFDFLLSWLSMVKIVFILYDIYIVPAQYTAFYGTIHISLFAQMSPVVIQT